MIKMESGPNSIRGMMYQKNAGSALKQFGRSLNLTDKTLLLYLLSITILTVIRITALPGWKLQLAANFLIFAAIFILALWDKRFHSRSSRFLHTFYPVFLLIWLYPQACMLRHAIIAVDLDPTLLRWELALFGQEWYKLLPQRLNLFWLEFFHGAYFVYYIGLGLFAMLANARQPEQVRIYLFTLVATMMIHQWFLILFPASGPVYLRAELIPRGVVFIPLMNWIYANLDRGGGAFPSLHAAAAVIMTFFAIRFFPRWKYPLLLFLAAILTATVAGSFHYVIDTVAGTVSGYICYLAGPVLYAYFSGNDSQ